MQENHFKILRVLEADPHLTQRDISRKTGISLGRVNCCLKALTQKGLIKMGNFSRSKNKTKYVYLLTAKGLEQKARATYYYLKRKMAEYETLRSEIEELQQEVAEFDAGETLKS